MNIDWNCSKVCYLNKDIEFLNEYIECFIKKFLVIFYDVCVNFF